MGLKMNQNQRWNYVGDVTFQHTRQKRALSLGPSPVHVASSGVIGRMLVGLRTGNLMSAQDATTKGTPRRFTMQKISNRGEQLWTPLVGSRSKIGSMTRHLGAGGR